LKNRTQKRKKTVTILLFFVLSFFLSFFGAHQKLSLSLIKKIVVSMKKKNQKQKGTVAFVAIVIRLNPLPII